MGILSRLSTIFKAKANKFLEGAEKPEEILEYSYEKQLELLQKVRRNMAEMVASKKRLELQALRLKENLGKLEARAKEALKLGREDLAAVALEQKVEIQAQLTGLEEQVENLAQEQEKLVAAEARLRTKVEAFRSKKEMVKAQYSAAEAKVKIGEAATGLSEELADVGMAIGRAEEKTEKMQARAAAIDELVESGVLEEPWEKKDKLEVELQKAAASGQVQAELARLKKEVASS